MNLWLISVTSLPQIPKDQAGVTRLMVRATDASDAWDQARLRLGDTSCVLSVKPLLEDTP